MAKKITPEYCFDCRITETENMTPCIICNHPCCRHIPDTCCSIEDYCKECGYCRVCKKMNDHLRTDICKACKYCPLCYEIITSESGRIYHPCYHSPCLFDSYMIVGEDCPYCLLDNLDLCKFYFLSDLEEEEEEYDHNPDYDYDYHHHIENIRTLAQNGRINGIDKYIPIWSGKHDTTFLYQIYSDEYDMTI